MIKKINALIIITVIAIIVITTGSVIYFFSGIFDVKVSTSVENETQVGRFVKFYSSDKKLDNFLNDFLKRNLRFDSTKVGWAPEEKPDYWAMFSKQWDTMYHIWFDTTNKSLSNDRQLEIKDFLSNIPVDKFGYTWTNSEKNFPLNGTPGQYFSQGWPFPNYTHSRGNSTGWEFNTDSNVEGWNSKTLLSVDNTCLKVPLSGKLVEIVSPDIQVNSFHSPFIELDLKIDGATKGKPVEAVKLYWQTEDDKTYSENKSITSTKDATIPMQSFSDGIYHHLFFPVYLYDGWKEKKITKLKIVIENSTDMVDQSAYFNFVRLNYDSRQVNNNAILISASTMYYMWTGDTDFLNQNMPRLRKAMEFMNTHMKGREKGILDNTYMPGHDGIRSVGHGLGNGYWDILSLGVIDSYSTTYYYRALKDMQTLEKAVEEKKLNIEKPTVVSPNLSGTIKYKDTSKSLGELMKNTKTQFSKNFWNYKKGRFIGGVSANEEKIDFGFINLNLESVESGIATEEQEKKIMDWINGTRVVTGENSTGEDIYFFKFAPRTTTIKNELQYLWEWTGVQQFGYQIQDGGTSMYLSYYDLVSRLNVLGTENAFKRLKTINQWYDDVSSVTEIGKGFYEKYYEKWDIKLQGIPGPNSPGPGGIGLKDEFLESALMYSAVPFGFFGLSSTSDGVLNIYPKLPADLKYWGIKNVTFRGSMFDIEMGKNYLKVFNVRNGDKNLKASIKLDKIYSNAIVKKDGHKFTKWEEDENCVVFEVPLENVVYSID